MTKQREINKDIVKEIQGKLETASSVVVTDYRGLNVAQVTELRKELRDAGVEYRVLKNTLTRLAAKESGIEGLEDTLTGPNAIAFSPDPVSAAKVLYEFAKNCDKLEIKGGVLEGKVISTEELKALSELPSREVLLSMVLRSMVGPLTNFASVLNAPLRDLVGVLSAVKEQKEANA
ncbi:50S ribosomal protein L10 [Clostridia bacterium]|nr:50S ribosomal protein L10 [Clostridia bacterium]